MAAIMTTIMMIRREKKTSAPLFTLPYWSRLWIVQEILLARRITVHYDGLQLPWVKPQDFAASTSSDETFSPLSHIPIPQHIISFLLPGGTNSRYSKSEGQLHAAHRLDLV